MGIAFKPGTRPYRHRKQHDIMLQSDTFRRDSCAQENLRGMRFAGIRLWRRYPARILRIRAGRETSCHLVPGYVRRHACIKGPCNSRDTNSETNRCCQEALVRRTRVPGSGAWIQYPEREHKSKTSSHGNEVPFTKCGCNMRGTQILFWPTRQRPRHWCKCREWSFRRFPISGGILRLAGRDGVRSCEASSLSAWWDGENPSFTMMMNP